MIGASISRWTMAYFATALACLLVGELSMAGGFGYPSAPVEAPVTLAVVHLLTIGWLALLFFGALLQFVPVLVAKPLRAPWVAAPALVAIIAGLGALVAGFLALGGEIDLSPYWLPVGASLLLSGFGALTVSLGLSLFSGRPLGIPARMVAVGLGALAVTVVLGAVFSVVLSGLDAPEILYRLLPVGVPFHAAFGLMGWMTLTAFGVSYRLFTMFMLAPEGSGMGRSVLLASVAALAAVAASLCAYLHELPGPRMIAVLAVALTLASVALYARDILGIWKSRRRKALELNSSASLVALCFLVASLVLFAASGLLKDPAGLAIPAVYLLVFGWLTGLGLGQLYKIVAFLTWLECYGPVMGRTPVPRVQDLVNENRAALWFWLHFTSVACGCIFLVFEAPIAFRAMAACHVLAVVGLAFEYIQARRLAYASDEVRLPNGAIRPHLIFPRTQTR